MQRNETAIEIGEAEQHSVLTSVLLHLAPGLVHLLAIFALSQPVLHGRLGIASELGPVFGYIAASLFVLVPILFGWLVYEGRKRNGRLSLDGIIRYTQRSPIWQYFVLVPILTAFLFLLFMFVAPIIQPFIVGTFFSWWPQEYNFQNALQDPAQFSSYSGAQALAILYVLTLGILVPVVEELYFRGYLLPRMEGYARNWAPPANAVLFSVYHFFSPWENPVRIVALLPVVYLVWRRRDIRFGIFTHVLGNMIGGVVVLAAVFLL
jgi:membrane protease YdiL (CAAX protease family)